MPFLTNQVLTLGFNMIPENREARFTHAEKIGVPQEAVRFAREIFQKFPSDWSIFMNTEEDPKEIILYNGNMHVEITYLPDDKNPDGN